MLEGKRFLPETGIPILKIARKMVLLAVELPEPFLVPTIMEKSFTTLFMILLNVMESISLLMRCPANLAPNLRSLIQQVGMSDQCLIACLVISITNRLHHLLVVAPYFLQIFITTCKYIQADFF